MIDNNKGLFHHIKEINESREWVPHQQITLKYIQEFLEVDKNKKEWDWLGLNKEDNSDTSTAFAIATSSQNYKHPTNSPTKHQKHS